MLPPALAGFLLINPRSGKGRPTVDELAAAARERGIDVHVLREGDDPAALMRTRPGAHALGIAGGDGSLAPAAQVAIERELPFVCVPFGTRNHFARDLGLDRADPLAALAAFSAEERRIDLGRWSFNCRFSAAWSRGRYECSFRQAASTSGTFSNASSSAAGSSSRPNQRSSETSSAGAASPPTTWAVQYRFSVASAVESPPYRSIQMPRKRCGSTSSPVSSLNSRRSPSSGSSPSSRKPPGMPQKPWNGGCALRASRTRPLSTQSAPAVGFELA